MLRVSLIILLIELSSHFANLTLELAEPSTLALILLLPLLLLPSSLPYSIFNHCKGRETDYKAKGSLFEDQPFNCRAFVLLFSLSFVCIVTALATVFLYGSDQSSQKLIALLIIIAISFIYALLKISISVCIASRSKKNKCCHCFFVELITAVLAEDLRDGGKKEER